MQSDTTAYGAGVGAHSICDMVAVCEVNASFVATPPGRTPMGGRRKAGREEVADIPAVT